MKTFTILVSICLAAIAVRAQSIFIKPYVGYGYGTNGSELSMQSSYYFENNDSSFTTYAYESDSLGKGAKFGIAIGSYLNKNLAIEFAVDYSKGKSPDFIEHNNGTYDYGTIYTLKFTDNYHYEGKSVQIAPVLIYKVTERKITPYLKLGAIIGITKLSENYERRLYNSIPSYYPFESWTSVLKFKKSISAGVTAAIGFELKLTDDIYCFTEAKYSVLNCAPKSSELTESAYRGEDNLESLPYNERNFEYVKTYTDADNTDTSVAGKRLIQQYALSNLTMVVGLKMDFNLNREKRIGFNRCAYKPEIRTHGVSPNNELLNVNTLPQGFAFSVLQAVGMRLGYNRYLRKDALHIYFL